MTAFDSCVASPLRVVPFGVGIIPTFLPRNGGPETHSRHATANSGGNQSNSIPWQIPILGRTRN